jgi:hypothetical protein
VRGVVLEGLGNGFLECYRSEAIKERDETAGEATQVATAAGDFREEVLAFWDGVVEAINAPVLCGLSFVIDERLDVRWVLDLLAAIEASWMGSDCVVAIEDSDGREACHHDEGFADVGVGHRVVVEVEADVGVFPDLDLDSLVGGEGIVGKGQEAWFFLSEGLAHGAGTIFRATAIGCDTPAPLKCLVV